MSVHVLLNLLKELRKRGKMRGLPCMLFFFRNQFNKFNNAGARMLDSYQILLKLLKITFGLENVKICHLLRGVIIAWALYHSQT